MATKGYTTVAKVSEYMGTTISNSTAPTTAAVTSWIEWAEKQIDSATGVSFTSDVATNVYVETTGAYNLVVPIEYTPLVSLSTVQVNSGTNFSETWTTLTEGTDFIIVDKDTGKLLFNTDVSFKGLERGLKIGVLTYGFDETPKLVEELATRLVAKQFVNSKLSNTASTTNESIKVGPITLKNDSGNSVTIVQNLTNEINDLYDKLGDFRTYIY